MARSKSNKNSYSKFSPPVVKDEFGFPAEDDNPLPPHKLQPQPPEQYDLTEPEPEPAPVTTPTPTVASAPTAVTVVKISKVDAVKAAIDAGYETAKVAIPWIKQKFGVDVGVPTFSTCKQNLKKRGSVTKVPVAKPTTTFAAARTVPPAAPTSAAALIRAVKDLVDRYGAAEVSEVMAVLEE